MQAALVHRYAESDVPTEYGTVRVIVYRVGSDEPPRSFRHSAIDSKGAVEEHMALVVGDLRAGGEPVLTRVHSECWTGEVIHSQKCDCREQLDKALREIARAGQGVVVYLRQEGRGIGLGNKIRAYALQEQGHDTVDANRMLGFGDDQRTYEVAAAIYEDLGVKRVALLTNNPAKAEALKLHGIDVVRQVPLSIPPNEFSSDYLAVKATRMGHKL